MTPVGVEKRGEFDFHFRDRSVDDDSMHVHVFAADAIEGEPEATEEAVPEWHRADELPYDEMWSDDRVWLPHLIAGETFRGEFVLSDDGESLVSYEMEIGVDME